MPAVLHVKPSASFAQSEPLTVNPSVSLSFGPSVPLQSQKVWASSLPCPPHCPPPSHLHSQGASHITITHCRLIHYPGNSQLLPTEFCLLGAPKAVTTPTLASPRAPIHPVQAIDSCLRGHTHTHTYKHRGSHGFSGNKRMERMKSGGVASQLLCRQTAAALDPHP